MLQISNIKVCRGYCGYWTKKWLHWWKEWHYAGKTLVCNADDVEPDKLVFIILIIRHHVTRFECTLSQLAMSSWNLPRWGSINMTENSLGPLYSCSLNLRLATIFFCSLLRSIDPFDFVFIVLAVNATQDLEIWKTTSITIVQEDENQVDTSDDLFTLTGGWRHREQLSLLT